MSRRKPNRIPPSVIAAMEAREHRKPHSLEGLIAVRIDHRTTVYYRPELGEEEINRRVELRRAHAAKLV